MNVFAFIADIENLRLVARAFAVFANQFDVGEELHLHRHGAVALARLTATAGNIKTEVARAISHACAIQRPRQKLRGSRQMP